MLLKIRQTFLACFVVIPLGFAAAAANGAVIFTNPINDLGNPSTANPYTAGQTVAANMTASGIGRGSGINPNAATNRYNARDWSFPSFDANDYFTFTLDANAGFEIDFTSFVYTGQASGTGPQQFAFRSSVDAFAANIGTPTAAGTTISLASAAYQNLTAPIEFRFYGWAGTAVAGTFSINDFTFNGIVNALADPDIDPALTSVIFPDRIINSAATQGVMLSEVGGAAANYTSSFIADATVTAGGAGAIAANGSGSISVGLTNLGTAGPKSGTVTIDDGNADLDQIAVSGDVFDPSTAAFASNSGNGLSLDFGTLDQNSGMPSILDAIANLVATAGYTAELDLDSILGVGDTSVLSTSLTGGAFTNLVAGGSHSFAALFDTNNAPGTYTATYTLGLSDADTYTGAGAAGSQSLTLNLTGTIIPEPSSLTMFLVGFALFGSRRQSAR